MLGGMSHLRSTARRSIQGGMQKRRLSSAEMLPEAQQGKGSSTGMVLFGGFLAGVWWQWKGITERHSADGKARHIQFAVAVVPTDNVFGVQCWQRLDSRPWGTESTLAKSAANSSSSVVTNSCFRTAPRDAEQASDMGFLGNYHIKIIPKEAGNLGIIYESWTPQDAVAIVDTASGKRYEVSVKTSFTYESLLEQLLAAGASEDDDIRNVIIELESGGRDTYEVWRQEQYHFAQEAKRMVDEQEKKILMAREHEASMRGNKSSKDQAMSGNTGESILTQQIMRAARAKQKSGDGDAASSDPVVDEEIPVPYEELATMPLAAALEALRKNEKILLQKGGADAHAKIEAIKLQKKKLKARIRGGR